MFGVGIDIGTTTVCGVLVNGENAEVVDTVTLRNDAGYTGENPWEKVQDPVRIEQLCRQIYERLTAHIASGAEVEAGDSEEEQAKKNPRLCIGVSGQMHGILYIDGEGNPVSPLYTWQDQSGNRPYRDQMTYCGYLSGRTGYAAATGYGLVTHFYHICNGLVPDHAWCLCTIGDYIAMRLAGLERPVLHPSMAASLGFFDIAGRCFDAEALRKAGIDSCLLPAVEIGEKLLYNDGEKAVAMALGDNQSSFLGATYGMEGTVLLNIGTGSQISVLSSMHDLSCDVECRPYIGDTCLFVGSPLCGGYAYELLKKFYERTAKWFGYEIDEDALYEKMNEMAGNSLNEASDERRDPVDDDRMHAADGGQGEKSTELTVDTRFKGSREEPELRGSIFNIDIDNFTPENLTYAFLRGTCRELYDIFEKIPEELKRTVHIIGSGNGVRKNRVMRTIIQDMFKKELKLPRYKEEAAYGAALYSMMDR